MEYLDQINKYWAIFVTLAGLVITGFGAWYNLKIKMSGMKQAIKTNKIDADRDIKDVNVKLINMDRKHDERLGKLEGGMEKILISNGKIETKVEMILIGQDRDR